MEQQFPPPYFLSGTSYGYYDYGVTCPSNACPGQGPCSYPCILVSRLAALSQADGRQCVQVRNGGCTVTDGRCP